MQLPRLWLVLCLNRVLSPSPDMRRSLAQAASGRRSLVVGCNPCIFESPAYSLAVSAIFSPPLTQIPHHLVLSSFMANIEDFIAT
ncbi:hypothetical protein IW262DRAFT_1335286 [Armillaria fumosa]|nr:hypothetical protein IW262DRAFT_1335286 [Armillaria fumosa]